MILHIVVCTPLISLIFSIPPGIQGVDIYQEVIDDLQFEDPRVPRPSLKKRVSSPEKGINVNKDVIVDESSTEENEKLLSECNSKLTLVEIEKTSCIAKQQGDGVPLFKQFIRRISDVVRPVDGDQNTLGAKILFKKEQFDELQNILQKQLNAKKIIDLFDEYDAFHPLENSVSIWSKWLTQFNIPLLTMVVAAILVSFLVQPFLKRIFVQELNWKRNVVFIIFISFLFSIPWEWYRMYRVAYSKKMSESMKDIPAECNPDKNTMFQGLVSFLSNKFTFSADECAKYHETLLVDPLWEVSPLNAISVCISRFVLEPMKLFSEELGVSFRLFFKEIPAQWQPFLFLALIFLLGLLIITCSGLRIETPFLKINVNPQPAVQYLQAPPPQNAAPVQLLEQNRNQQGRLPASQTQDAAPVQLIEQNQNQQGRLPASQMQDDHNDRRETNVAQQQNIGENNSGVMEVQSEKLCEALKELSLAKDNSQLGTKECGGIQNEHVQDLRNANDNASAEPTRHVDGNIPTLVRDNLNCPSEHLDIQEDGKRIARRSLPTESEYHSLRGDLNPAIDSLRGDLVPAADSLRGDLNPAVEDVQPSQGENDTSSMFKCHLMNGTTVDLSTVASRMSGGTHIDESPSSIVVPNESSVFSMPTDTGHSIAEMDSIAEMSAVPRRRIHSSEGDATVHESEDSSGSVNVENVSFVS